VKIQQGKHRAESREAGRQRAKARGALRLRSAALEAEGKGEEGMAHG